MKIKFKTAYQCGERIQLICTDPSLTEQSHKDECDVNFILRKYQQTGVIEHQNQYEGFYGDITGHDFQSAMELIANAQSMFNDLPSSVRSHFYNDPARFLDFCQEPGNIEQLRKWGLAEIPYEELVNVKNPTPGGDSPRPDEGSPA